MSGGGSGRIGSTIVLSLPLSPARADNGREGRAGDVCRRRRVASVRATVRSRVVPPIWLGWAEVCKTCWQNLRIGTDIQM